MGMHVPHPWDFFLVWLLPLFAWVGSLQSLHFVSPFFVGAHCFAWCQVLTVFCILIFPDSDLQDISDLCVSLCYINLKACTSVTDMGMSILIRRCFKLQSILVCDTLFGRNSILALCCSIPNSGNSAAVDFGNKQQNSVALKLQTLHMGGCKGNFFLMLSLFRKVVFWHTG